MPSRTGGAVLAPMNSRAGSDEASRHHFLPAGIRRPGNAQTPPGAALPSGYLSIVGNQFVSDSSGKNVRIASTSYRGTPTDQASMNAIRQAGFNAIRIDWRDAYLSAGGGGTPTFDDEFASAPWLTHATWQSGDTWSFAGVNFPGGTSQGPTWWSNPVDTPSAAPVYSDSGGHLNLGLIQNPGGNGISNTTLGALINNQETPGGLVQLFGDYQFSIAVPNTPGFLFQWDIECFPATCSDGNMEIDVGIWTNGDGSEHVQLMSQANNLNNVVWYSGTPVDITQQNVYEVNWQTDFITFYINGTQMAQVPNPGGEFRTAGALSYFLTSDATYFGYGPAFTAASATAQLDYYRIYQTKPSGSAPVGCNTLAQMDQCVALAAAATPQPLKVIFSHRGNEIPSSPSNACNARQANGLWFDSGGSSGNDDGCGDGGNVTYATFKANTAALMQRYAGNSTVIGYDFHAEPLVNGAFTGTGGGGATGQFSVNSSGQIIDPNGNVFIARGLNSHNRERERLCRSLCRSSKVSIREPTMCGSRISLVAVIRTASRRNLSRRGLRPSRTRVLSFSSATIRATTVRRRNLPAGIGNASCRRGLVCWLGGLLQIQSLCLGGDPE